jgi:prohibitin 1
MEKMFDRMGKLGLVFIGLGVIGTRFVFVVDGGQRALIFNKLSGLKDTVYGEGMHFKVPLIMTPRYFEIRSRPRLISSTTGTRDLQQVDLTLRILFRPQEDKLSHILNEIGIDYDDKVIPSIGNEVLKSVVAQYDAGNLIQKRNQVSHDIRTALQKRANDFGLILDDVSITHLQFSREFAYSIEQKQVA